MHSNELVLVFGSHSGYAVYRVPVLPFLPKFDLGLNRQGLSISTARLIQRFVDCGGGGDNKT